MGKGSNSLSDVENEADLIESLGGSNLKSQKTEEELLEESGYNIVPSPVAEVVDLSDLRGVASGEGNKKQPKNSDASSDTDLEGLAELVPDIKARRKQIGDNAEFLDTESLEHLIGQKQSSERLDIKVEPDGAEVQMQKNDSMPSRHRMSMNSLANRRFSDATSNPPVESTDRIDQTGSLLVQESRDMEEKRYPFLPQSGGTPGEGSKALEEGDATGQGFEDTSFEEDMQGGSDHALEEGSEERKIPKEFMNMDSSAQSISTATQTHEVRMPMYLPTFKPATGCTNASDFIVRCFVARLRSGITVVKHGRSRWCKSRLRVLHIHPDGRSLSWKPAEGEPKSSNRPPKLDLSTCLEVRHAWSPDPQNPMYTGTPILRQKCEAANAHKSFALIFKQRTVDITAVTADQCKVLMEGFSALCFRLQVANLAGRGAKKGHARPMPEEDGISTTASATLTNTSTPRAAR